MSATRKSSLITPKALANVSNAEEFAITPKALANVSNAEEFANYAEGVG
jgi:hypothetical protein